MKIVKFILFSSLVFSQLSFSDNNLEQFEKYNVDVNDVGTQFVQNWQEISKSILEEIEKINLMNESNFNRLPEKRFISLISDAVQSYPQTLLSLEQRKEVESTYDLARSALFPNINLGAGSGEQSSEYPTGTIKGSQDRFSLSLSQLLFDFNQTKLNIESAKKKY